MLTSKTATSAVGLIRVPAVPIRADDMAIQAMEGGSGHYGAACYENLNAMQTAKTGSAMAHHVVIVGAGFAGLSLAQPLGSTPLRVTVIDRRNYHLFQPLLY